MKAAFVFALASLTGALAQTCPSYAVTVTPLPVTVTITANATTFTAPTPTKTVYVTCPPAICKPQTCGNFIKRCDPKLDCWCGLSAEGTGFCFQNAWCKNLKTCQTSRECPSGTACAVKTCCGVGVCVQTKCTSTGPVKRGFSLERRQSIAEEDMIAFTKGSKIPSLDESAP